MKEVFEFLKKVGTYYLATVDGNEPRVRPFGTVNIYNDRLYIQTGLKKDVTRQMLKNPFIELTAFDGDNGVRVSAKAVLDEDICAQESMLSGYPELSEMYKAGDGNTAVFYLENAKATFYAFGQPPRIVEW